MAVLKDLIVHGSSRFLNKIYASQIQAESGIFNKLIAKDATIGNATVVGLLDIKGQLHTSSWTNSNIATIDGSFYITPTIGSDEGSVAVTATTLSFSGGTYAVESLYLGDESSNSSIIWPRYSKVLVTGQILSNGEWLPLGTLRGELGATASSSSINVINIKDNKTNTNNNNSNVLATIVANGTSSTDYRNLKVSLYQRAVSSTDLRPLGIYMTAAGRNGTTFLDIYGGTKTLLSLTDTDNNAFSGFAEPVLRIGNLNGLPAVGNQTPNGWGIYTTHGYFKGTIAAQLGVIGGWTIASDGLYYGGSSTAPGANNVLLSPGKSSSTAIGGSSGTLTWVITAGTTFGVTTGGDIYATSGKIGGFTIGTDVIKNTKTSYSETSNNGVWLGTDGIGLGKGTFYVTSAGAMTAKSGTIAGWRIESSYLASGSATGPTANALILSPSGTSGSYTVAGQAKTGWMITAGTTFGVNKDGGIYATSGKIGGFDIGTSSIKNTKTSYSETTNNGIWLGTDGIGLGKGLFYVTNAGALTAKSGSIAGWSFNASSLYKTNATPGYNASTMVLSTGTASTNNIGGGGTTSKTWMISAGTGFGVTTAGTLYCNDAHISGEITATSGSIASSVTIGTGGVSLSTVQSNASNGKEAYDLQYSSDTRNTNENPQYYITNYPRRQVNEFKSASVIGLTTGSGFCALTTIVPWGDSSGGYPKQEANFKGKRYWRQGTSATAWSAWVDASAVATSYIVADSTGLMIADMSGGTATSSNVSSQNVFIDSSSINIRNGQDVLAKFGATGAQIGQDGTPHINIGYDSISLVNEKNAEWFNVDLDASELDTVIKKASDNIASTEERITSNISRTETITLDISEIPTDTQMRIYPLPFFRVICRGTIFDPSSATFQNIQTISSSRQESIHLYQSIYLTYLKGTSYPNKILKAENIKLKDAGNGGNFGTFNLTGTFSYSGGDIVTLTITYSITNYKAPFLFRYQVKPTQITYHDISPGAALSFGQRVTDNIGATSTILGTGLQAGYLDQLVIGHYNINSSQNAFEIGSGEEYHNALVNNNAFEVTWYGDIRFNQYTYMSQYDSIDMNLQMQINALGWENEVTV